jgi:predicted  nucleic acid-binding Zn-ribbon protein
VTPDAPSDDKRQLTIQLVALADVDKKRAEVQKLIDAVPRVLASRQRESKDAEAGVAAAKTKLQGFRSHLKNLELDLAQREEALQKANGNLLSAKTNQEYSLLMAEIGRKKEEKSRVEELVIEQFDVIKQGEGLVEEAGERLKEAEKDYEGFEARARTEIATHQQELAELDARRATVRKGIDGEVLKLYDRVYKAHGTAVVPAEGNTCQGCFSTLTPNDCNRLLTGRQLVTCRGCQRILYMPEVLQASSS